MLTNGIIAYCIEEIVVNIETLTNKTSTSKKFLFMSRQIQHVINFEAFLYKSFCPKNAFSYKFRATFHKDFSL